MDGICQDRELLSLWRRVTLEHCATVVLPITGYILQASDFLKSRGD
jgi:hypothetical protein